MVTLERMLFDVTEAWHHMGILQPDRYVTVSSLVYSMILTAVLLPLLYKGLYWLYINEGYEQYIYNGVIVITGGFLILMKAYGALLFVILYYLFYAIVVMNPKYKYIKDYIERLF